MKSLLKGRKGGTAKVDFQVTIHTLAPWAPGGGPLAVAWRRGAAKRGLAGPPVHPSLAGGGGYAAYDFGQAFTVPATLTKSAPAAPFDSKLLTLELVPSGDASSPSSSPSPVGRVILDLATFAPGGPRAGGGAAHACAVGPASPASPSPSGAQLLVTVACRGGGGGGTGGAPGTAADSPAAAATLAAAAMASPAKEAAPPTTRPPLPLSDSDDDADALLLAAAAAAADARDDAAAADWAGSDVQEEGGGEEDRGRPPSSGGVRAAVAAATAAAAAAAAAPNPFEEEEGDAAAGAASPHNPFFTAQEEPTPTPAPPAPAPSPAKAVPGPGSRPPSAGGGGGARTPPAFNPFLDGGESSASPPRGRAGLDGEDALDPVSMAPATAAALVAARGPPPPPPAPSPPPSLPRPRSTADTPASLLPPRAPSSRDPGSDVEGGGAPSPFRRAGSRDPGSEVASPEKPPLPLPPPARPSPTRALLDEAGAAVAANRSFARRAAAGLGAGQGPPSAADVAAARAVLAAAGEGGAAAGSSRPGSAPGTGAGASALAAAEAAAAASSASLASAEGELLTVAALEAGVFLARGRATALAATTHHHAASAASPRFAGGGRAHPPSRSVHAPARRLARTIVSLGPARGPAFGARALAAVRGAADAAAAGAGGPGGSVALSAHWWSNTLQLRWMLWAMGSASADEEGEEEGGGGPAAPGTPLSGVGGGSEFAWVLAGLVPPLRSLEEALLCRALDGLWDGMVGAALAAAAAAAASGGGGRAAAAAGAPPPDAAAAGAISLWLEALRGARRELSTARGAVSAGHGALLKQRALGALLRRLDATLFAALLSPSPTGPASPSSSSAAAAAAAAAATLVLPPALLPFSPLSPLSFDTGVALKLAAGRLADWAESVGVRVAATGAVLLDGGGDPVAAAAAVSDAGAASLFPRLRGAADLLMMPKAALAGDAALRSTLVSQGGLTPGAALALLSRSEPDEDGDDGAGSRLLGALAAEAGPGGLDAAIAAAAADAAAWPPGAADPPAEAALAADASLADPLSLEMDAASGDELDDLAAAAEGGGEGGEEAPRRFDLLRELWASAR